MKMRLLLFLSLLVGSVGFSLLSSSNTYALGEGYKWIDATTIEASGGSFSGTIVTTGSAGPSRPTPVGTVRFVRDANTKTFKAQVPAGGIYTGNAGGGGGLSISTKCDLQLSITVSAQNAGSIATNDAGQRTCSNTGLTSALTIGDTNKAPTPESLGVPATTTTGPGAPIGETAAGDEASSCKVDGIGWIICPVVRTMASLVDGAYTFVESLLRVQPIVMDNKGAGESVYGAWSVMRNFANIAFVIAFLIIIFSQLTSVGLNNYGIKKMLPRLIVAAILVNSSFWICAIAVDISNILGSSLNNLIADLPVNEANSTKFTFDDGQTGTGWAGIAGGVLAATAIAGTVLYATLSALLPALLAALVAIVTVFIVLTIRQALIILLIVISPLAFVAYLLPNTENLFKKWLALFKTMLLMYPIIAMIFGASALASEVVMTSADGDYKVAIQIMGALISIIPLALTPVVMKTAGGLLNKIGGVVNNPNKGPVDKLRKGAEGFRDRRQAIAGARRMDRGRRAADGVSSAIKTNSTSRFGRIRNRVASPLGSAAASVMSSGATTAYDAQQKNENAKRALTEGQQDYVANRASTDQQYAASIAGPTGSATKVQATAVATMRNRQQSEIKDAGEIIYNLNLPPDEIRKLAMGMTAQKDGKIVADSSTNLALKNAARQLVVNNGDAIGMQQMLDSTVGNTNEKDRLGVADAFGASNNRPAFVSQGYMGAIRQGNNGNTQAAIEDSIVNNTWSAEAIAAADKDIVNMVARTAKTTTNPKVLIEHKQRLVNNAHEALTDPDLKVKLGKSLDDVVDLRDHKIPRRVIT